MLCGESAGMTALHGQLLQLTYNIAEPITNSTVAASAAHGAGVVGVVEPVPRRSSGIATAITPATVSAAASRTNVIISGSGPLPAARGPAARARGARGPCAPRAARPSAAGS